MGFTSKTFVALATGFLALTDVVAATGNAIVNNNCDFDVYVWHVSVDKTDSEPTTINANGGHYSEPYVACSTGGVSLKLSNSSTDETYITQYEYTLDPGNVWYDISNVNCKDGNCPFWQGGMKLASNTNCPVVNCAANTFVCHAAYNLFNDDWASHACAPTSDLTLTLCPNGSGGSSAGSGSAGGSSSSAAESSSAAATTPTSTWTPPKTTPSSTPVHVKADIVQPTPSSSSSTTTTTSTTPSPTSSTTLSTSTTSTPKPKLTSKKHSHKAKPKPHTTAAPVVDVPIVTQWFTETAIETAYSTVIVTARDAAHDDFHKNKKREAMLHRHHRRHEHF